MSWLDTFIKKLSEKELKSYRVTDAEEKERYRDSPYSLRHFMWWREETENEEEE